MSSPLLKLGSMMGSIMQPLLPTTSIFRKDRGTRGGVCIITKASLRPERIMPDASFSDLELLFVDLLSTSSPPLRIAAAYCPPCHANNRNYIQKIMNCLQSMTRRGGEIIIMGDFNRPGINWLSWERITCSTAIDLMFRDGVSEMGLTQAATFPTRGPNYLTLVMASSPDSIVSIEALPPFNNSDSPPHLPVLLSIIVCSNIQHTRPVKKNYSAIDYTWACTQLSQVDFSSFLSSANSYDALYDTICEILSSAPTRRIFRHRPPAWDMARLKNRAWRIFKTHPNHHNRMIYDSISRSYSEQVSSIKSETLAAICSTQNRRAFYRHNSSNRSQSDYSTLRNDRGELCSSDLERAQVFLRVFSEAYRRDVPVDHSSFTAHDLSFDCRDMFESQHVYWLICSMKKYTAEGPDNIPSLFLKNTASVSARLLSALFTSFFMEGWIPPIWRTATIIPIFKGDGLASDARNYRPISLTSIMAKLYEKCILRRLLFFLSSNDLIPSGQFGGLPGRSTTQQMIYCYDQWCRIRESGEHYDVFFLDISKAFDRVPRSLLATRLCNMGMPHMLIRAIMLIFDDRTHRVRVGSTVSTKSPTSSGVIQGTVLGCILFVLFTAPLSSIIRPIVYSFVDDMKWTVETFRDSDAQSYLDGVISWLESSGLEVSARKSRVLHCGRHNPHQIYFANDSAIEAVDAYRDLGVYFSHNLSFNTHIDSIVLKANRSLFGVLSRYRGCDKSSLVLAYTTFIRPILEYAAPVWSPSNVLKIDHIERVQRSFTRRLFPFASTTYKERCARLSLHSLEWRRVYLDMCLLYTIMNNPIYCPPLDNPVQPLPPSITRGHDLRLLIPFARSNVRANSYFLRAFKIWNSLPANIVTSRTIGAFKNCLKNYDLSIHCQRFKF